MHYRIRATNGKLQQLDFLFVGYHFVGPPDAVWAFVVCGIEIMVYLELPC